MCANHVLEGNFPQFIKSLTVGFLFVLVLFAFASYTIIWTTFVVYHIYAFSSLYVRRSWQKCVRNYNLLKVPTYDSPTLFKATPVPFRVVDQANSTIGQVLRTSYVLNESKTAYLTTIIGTDDRVIGYLPKERPIELGDSGNYVPEMAVEGSKLMTDPDGHTVLLFDEGGTVVGNGFRIANHLITNRHVGEQSTLWGSPTSTCRVPLGHMRHFGDYDLVRYNVQPADFALLGVKAVKSFGRLRPNARIQVRGYYPGEPSSYVSSSGRVGDAAGEGLVKHYATTYPGMSGSPVYCNGKLVGIHTCSSATGEQINYLFCFEIVRSFFNSLDFVKKGISREFIPESWDGQHDHYYDEETRYHVSRNRKLARAYSDPDFAIDEEDDDYESYAFARDSGYLEGGPVDYDDFVEFMDGGNVSSHGSAAVKRAVRDYKLSRGFAPESARIKLVTPVVGDGENQHFPCSFTKVSVELNNTKTNALSKRLDSSPVTQIEACTNVWKERMLQKDLELLREQSQSSESKPNKVHNSPKRTSTSLRKRSRRKKSNKSQLLQIHQPVISQSSMRTPNTSQDKDVSH
jgi:hypothetical protein